jgi:hypothetical protein
MSGQVSLTSGCSNPPDDKRILFPSGATLPEEDYVLVALEDKERILKSDQRADAGDAACVSPSVLRGFGSKGVVVEFRGIGTRERVLKDSALFLQLVIAVLTWAGALIAGIGSYIKDGSPTATPWEQNTAILALLITAVLATIKLVQELNEA